MGNMILPLPVEATSSLWFRSAGSPQLSAQHLAYVGQHSQPLSGIATPCSLSDFPAPPSSTTTGCAEDRVFIFPEKVHEVYSWRDAAKCHHVLET